MQASSDFGTCPGREQNVINLSLLRRKYLNLNGTSHRWYPSRKYLRRDVFFCINEIAVQKNLDFLLYLKLLSILNFLLTFVNELFSDVDAKYNFRRKRHLKSQLSNQLKNFATYL